MEPHRARADRSAWSRSNLFLQDVYGQQRILKERKIPRSLVYSCQHFQREMIGVEVPRGIYTHICGIDLVRDSKTGDFWCWKTMCARPAAFPTCWKTGW